MPMSLRVLPSLGLLLVIISCGGGSSSPTSPLTGMVSGAVTSGGTGIPGASVTVTPSGQSALTSVTTSSTGSYSVSSVPVGSGAVTVSNLPAGCTAPNAGTYSSLTANGTVTVNIAVTCTVQSGTISAARSRITETSPGAPGHGMRRALLAGFDDGSDTTGGER
jgi:hypothetical protein